MLPDPLPCGCSPQARCAEAWRLRDALLAAPVDGTIERIYTRRALARTYAQHLHFNTAQWGTLYPIWSEGVYADPRQEEVPHG